jgi:hypothetical protein
MYGHLITHVVPQLPTPLPQLLQPRRNLYGKLPADHLHSTILSPDLHEPMHYRKTNTRPEHALVPLLPMLPCANPLSGHPKKLSYERRAISLTESSSYR